jgi:hypothetical protein
MESYDEVEDDSETEYDSTNSRQFSSPCRSQATSCATGQDNSSSILRKNLHHHSDVSQDIKQKASQNCQN